MKSLREICVNRTVLVSFQSKFLLKVCNRILFAYISQLIHKIMYIWIMYLLTLASQK